MKKKKRKRKNKLSSRHLPSAVGGHSTRKKKKNIKDTWFLFTFFLTLMCLCFFPFILTVMVGQDTKDLPEPFT
jgi:hypothetical protein